MKISVTQEHIDRSSGTGSVSNCPIAVALKDAGYANVAVGGFTVDLGDYRNVKFSNLDIEGMGQFMGNPTPREFELEIPA